MSSPSSSVSGRWAATRIARFRSTLSSLRLGSVKLGPDLQSLKYCVTGSPRTPADESILRGGAEGDNQYLSAFAHSPRGWQRNRETRTVLGSGEKGDTVQ